VGTKVREPGCQRFRIIRDEGEKVKAMDINYFLASLYI
jgi:hypothetical protein